MKKSLKNVLCLLALVAITAPTFGVITGSKHDFAGGGTWTSGTGEMCDVCHAPHNATNAADGPLWDHATTTQTFTPYDSSTSPTMNASVGAPSGASKLCLSCHDGVTALDSFAGATGTVLIGTIGTGSGDIGTDLSSSHPISFTYDDALATTDGSLYPPTTTASGITANIDDDMLFGASNDQVECASCHDVHNSAVPATTSLLVKSNAGSALCLTCHNK